MGIRSDYFFTKHPTVQAEAICILEETLKTQALSLIAVYWNLSILKSPKARVKNYQLEVNSDKHITFLSIIPYLLHCIFFYLSLYALYWCMYISVTCKIVDSIISAISY